MSIYRIKKSFQGGCVIYFAKMSPLKKLKKGCWESQLQEWGEGTNGGHAYGYHITATKSKRIPELKRVKLIDILDKRGFSFEWRIKIRIGEHYLYEPLRFLKFNPYYLEKA